MRVGPYSTLFVNNQSLPIRMVSEAFYSFCIVFSRQLRPILVVCVWCHLDSFRRVPWSIFALGCARQVFRNMRQVFRNMGPAVAGGCPFADVVADDVAFARTAMDVFLHLVAELELDTRSDNGNRSYQDCLLRSSIPVHESSERRRAEDDVDRRDRNIARCCQRARAKTSVSCLSKH